jgi:hypothetical protein
LASLRLGRRVKPWRFRFGRLAVALREHFQQPFASTQRQPELFEVGFPQLRQHIEVDIVRLEHLGNLLELIVA